MKKISSFDANEWDLLAEDVADATDTFAFARMSGQPAYELKETVQSFFDFARQNHAEETVEQAWKAFRKQTLASENQLGKVRILLKEAGHVLTWTGPKS